MRPFPLAHVSLPILVIGAGLGLPAGARGQGSGAERVARADPQEWADSYTEGLRLRDAGHWREALGIWQEARDQLAAEGLTDPRIGTAYVELATEKGAEDRYETASEMFLWGFSRDMLAGSEEALRDELERVLLIVDDDEAARLRSLRDAPPGELAMALKSFWIRRDPTPETALNERLLEHWSRIHEARERYVYNHSTPIGTDDRGTIYLKYGEPTRIRKGSLGASELELSVRLPGNPDGRANLRRYDVNPQYEVWVYDTLNDTGFTYFLFGNLGGTGPFELVPGVHDLIPDGAKSRASAHYTPGGLPASFYLELFYYQDLSRVGGRFGRRFDELDQIWNRYTARRRSFVTAGRVAPRETELEALQYRYRQEDEYFPEAPPQDPVLSDFEGAARDELVAQAVRTLSDDGVPLLVVLAASAPHLRIEDRRQFYRQRLEVPGWVMRHTLIIRDEDLEEVGRLQNPVDPARADLSAFVLRHVNRRLHLTVTAQTYRQNADTSAAESDRPGVVESERLPGQVFLDPPPPLSPDTSAFEMSDLVAGVAVPADIDADLLPYPLLPADRLWLEDPLRVYLELYHLGQRAVGGARVKASFRIVPIDPKGEPDRARLPIVLDDVRLTPGGRTYRQHFDIGLADQPPGRYRLEVTVTDEVRGESRTRTATFELVT